MIRVRAVQERSIRNVVENNIANARSFVPGLLWSDSTGNRAMEFNICKSLASSRNPVTGFFLSGMERTSATCNDAGNTGNLCIDYTDLYTDSVYDVC